jgi:hypothetical protein
MQLLANIAMGALLAGATLGPSGWAGGAEMGGRLVHAASRLAGVETAGSPLAHAVAKARAALPDLPHGTH